MKGEKKGPADDTHPSPRSPDRRRLGMATDVGRKRKVDEDSVLAAEVALGANAKKSEFRLLVVADGMGGHARGDTASQIALNSIARTVMPRLLDGTPHAALLADGIRNANADVLDHVEKNPDTAGMGTTAVCALVRNGEVHLVNIGDSRAYVVSPGEIRRVTKDHSYVQALVDGGRITEDEAKTHHQKNVITNAIGAMHEDGPDRMRLTLDEDEHLVLCCDGVTAHLADGEIRDAVLDCADPQEACERIVDTANERGGTDNISLIVLGAGA